MDWPQGMPWGGIPGVQTAPGVTDYSNIGTPGAGVQAENPFLPKGQPQIPPGLLQHLQSLGQSGALRQGELPSFAQRTNPNYYQNLLNQGQSLQMVNPMGQPAGMIQPQQPNLQTIMQQMQQMDPNAAMRQAEMDPASALIQGEDTPLLNKYMGLFK